MLTFFNGFRFPRVAAVVAIACASTIGSAQQAASSVNLAAALKKYQLQESPRPVRDLLPSWTEPKKLIVEIDKPERTAWLQEAMPEGVNVIGVHNEAEAASRLYDADALIQLGCRPDSLAKAPKVKWVDVAGGGADQCLAVPRIARGDILLTDGQKVKNTILAEMAMGYVFALARSIDVGLQNQRLGSQTFNTHVFSYITHIGDRRFPIVDEQRGIVSAIVTFTHPGNVRSVDVPGHGRVALTGVTSVFPNTTEIIESFRVKDGRIVGIYAYVNLLPYHQKTGW